jgi:hypothetical protein
MAAVKPPGLPSIADVDAADQHLGAFMSELDWFVTQTKRLEGDDLPVEDYVFLLKAGVDWPDYEIAIEPETFPRLLVFANQLEGDAEKIKEDAAELRRHLLNAYQEYVTEPRLRAVRNSHLGEAAEAASPDPHGPERWGGSA